MVCSGNRIEARPRATFVLVDKEFIYSDKEFLYWTKFSSANLFMRTFPPPGHASRGYTGDSAFQLAVSD